MDSSSSYGGGVNGLKSWILTISWHLIIYLKNAFLNSEFLKVHPSHWVDIKQQSLNLPEFN
jgi:hypothetical protein